MEEKKIGGGRVVGSKVSQIANIFQAMKGNEGDVLVLEPPKTPEGGPPPVTVVRTESHVARFNNARALFEKLGEENRSRAVSSDKSKVVDLRSRSSSANSSGGGDSPVRANRDPSPGQIALSPATNGIQHSFSDVMPVTRDQSEYSSEVNNTNTTSTTTSVPFTKPTSLYKSSVTPSNINQCVPTRPTDLPAKPVSVRLNNTVNGMAVPPDKPAKPEKPERKLNSRELIEKQKNWTMHFSKTRSTTGRYNSDPNKNDVKTGINMGGVKALSTTAVNKVSEPATRSASFNAPRSTKTSSSHPATPPPPPPAVGSPNSTSPTPVSPSSPPAGFGLPVDSKGKVIPPPKPESSPPYTPLSSPEKNLNSSVSTSSAVFSSINDINCKNNEQGRQVDEISCVAFKGHEVEKTKTDITLHDRRNRDQTLNDGSEVERAKPVSLPAEDTNYRFSGGNEHDSDISGQSKKDDEINYNEVDPSSNEGIFRFQPATVTNSTSSVLDEFVTADNILNSKNAMQMSLQEEEEALLRRLDELSVRSEEADNVKPIRFNLGDSVEMKSSAAAAGMCNSSMSEEDSGFVSSEAAQNRELLENGLNDSFAGLSDSCAGLLENGLTDSTEHLLEGGLLDVPDVQYADEDSEEEDTGTTSGVKEICESSSAVQQNTTKTSEQSLDTSFMTADEADNLLSTRSQEALLSDEEAQEVVRLLSPVTTPPTPEDAAEEICPSSDRDSVVNNNENTGNSEMLNSTCNDGTNDGRSSDKLDDSISASGLAGSITLEDSVISSCQFSSQSGSESGLLGSRDSLDDLDSSRRKRMVPTVVDEDDIYQGYVPEPNREVFEESGVHYFEDGHFWMEVPGLPESATESDDDGSTPIPVKANTKVTFSSSPIRVYSTFSMSEYDRRNEDVDPVAASAEYELEKRVEKLDMLTVELLKGPEGLGLSIIGMGVGADAGLEKLGIFVKTITEHGAAARDSRIQVNDQIIEVDGKSLVGVTQAYAASVLRNTCGHVKFLIGREKDPENSEVAQLIRQSLQADKEREEHRRQVERNINQFMEEESLPSVSSSEESMMMSSSHMQQDDGNVKALRQLLHELEELEESGASKEECAEKLRLSSLRLRELERSLAVSKNQANAYQEMLDQSQGQYMVLEKKYCKAKRLLREFHRRETDLLHREEFYLQMLQEKDTEYNALVKALKDRVIQIEQELLETQRRAGFPVRLPHDNANVRLSTPQMTRRPTAVQPLLEQLGAEISEAEDSPEEGDKTATVERKMPVKEELDRAVPPHDLLDVSANKSKAELANRGGLANRQLPTSGKKSGGLSNSSSEYGLDDSRDDSDDEDDNRRSQYIEYIGRDELSNISSTDTLNEVDNTTIVTGSAHQQYASVIRHRVHRPGPDPWLARHQHINKGSALSGPPASLAEQLKQVLAERERRMSGSGDINNGNSGGTNISQTLADEIRLAVNEANARVKKVPQSLVPPLSTQYRQQQSSPSSSGSVSPGVITADPSPSKVGSTDSSDVWSPLSQPQEFNASSSSITGSDKKSSHVWHSAPVPDWSKEQVCQWLLALGLEQYIPKFLEQHVNGNALLTLESRDLKNLGIVGDDKSRLKRKLKELRVQVEKERRQHDKERKEKERLLKKAEKLAEKASKRK